MNLTNSLLLSTLLCSLCFASCKSKQDVGTDGKKSTSTKSANTPTIPAVQVNKALDRSNNDKVAIKTVSVDGDIMRIVVSYGGGCKDHQFELWSDGNYAKSLPPQMNLFLKHDNAEDYCKAIVLDTLHYNLAPIQLENTNELILSINKSEINVPYKYK